MYIFSFFIEVQNILDFFYAKYMTWQSRDQFVTKFLKILCFRLELERQFLFLAERLKK